MLFRSNYGVLFSELKPGEAQAIVEKLKASNVAYSLSNGGSTVSVPSDRIAELRLQMAGEGALSGGHVGFDLFDKTNFGATDFAQQVNYRRAIEGELARTLEALDEVESARVHITPKKESVYSDKEEGAKASVMLRVKQNKALNNDRTEAVVSLIASAVEGPVTAMCPASAIQLHPHTTVEIDEAAASRLTLSDYFCAAFSGKPTWQSI